MFDWILTNYSQIIITALAVVGGASAIVKGMQPWLKHTDKDEKFLAFIQKVGAFLSKVALHPAPTPLPPQEPAPSQEKG